MWHEINPMTERTIRAEITTVVLRQAQDAAVDGAGTINYADTRERGLLLRVRGNSVSWLVKTRSFTRRIGAPPDMKIREAREAAAVLRGEMRAGTISQISRAAITTTINAPTGAAQISTNSTNTPTESSNSWTLKDLFLRYEIDREQPRVIRSKLREPARKTLAEIDLAFRRSAWDPLRDLSLDQLSEETISRALHCIQHDISDPQARKALMHFRAAMEWAASAQRAQDAGLKGALRWWKLLEIEQPSGAIAARLVARARPTANPAFTIEHLGAALARHEDFCRMRQGRERVSAAVRWGLWWVALTSARRAASTSMRNSDISFDDTNLQEGWALAKWRAETMKMRFEFWLPIPPLGVTILRQAQTGWLENMQRAGRSARETKWMFTSNTRMTRTGASRDAPLSEYALTTHLANMRGKRKQGRAYRDHLADLPYFTLHSMRSVMVSWIEEHLANEVGAASAMLGHQTLTAGEIADGMSPTTKRYYDRAQRIPLKSRVIHAWSNALIDAYEAAGGMEAYPRSITPP